MIRLAFYIILLTSSICNADVQNTINNAVEPQNWLKEAALKTGYVASICTYHALNGITEGYHFSQETKRIANEGNYHAYKTGRDVAGLSTGWFAYGMVRDSRAGWYTKGRRIVGGALIARNAFEWSYKAQRYGNPLDYSEEHNRHAVVYFGIRSGKVVDLYIGTGRATGPLVDIAVTVLGLWMIR
jgi:hypothetical protein